RGRVQAVSAQANGGGHRNEKRHLGQRPIAFAFTSEICRDIFKRKNRPCSRGFSSGRKQISCQRRWFTTARFLLATQSRFSFSARLRNLRVSTGRFDCTAASASLANWRSGRVAFVRRFRRKPFGRAEVFGAGKEAGAGFRAKPCATKTSRSRARLDR